MQPPHPIAVESQGCPFAVTLRVAIGREMVVERRVDVD